MDGRGRAVPGEVVVRLGVGFLGAAFLGAAVSAAGFLAVGFFAVAAFQPVPHTMQLRSVRALLVSQLEQRQSAAGLAAGRFGPDFGGGFGPVLGAAFGGVFGGDFGVAPGAAESRAGAVLRRVLPQIVHARSTGSLNVSQSAQRQFGDVATPLLPLLVSVRVHGDACQHMVEQLVGRRTGRGGDPSSGIQRYLLQHGVLGCFLRVFGHTVPTLEPLREDMRPIRMPGRDVHPDHQKARHRTVRVTELEDQLGAAVRPPLPQRGGDTAVQLGLEHREPGPHELQPVILVRQAEVVPTEIHRLFAIVSMISSISNSSSPSPALEAKCRVRSHSSAIGSDHGASSGANRTSRLADCSMTAVWLRA